ncbi:hypothetical protein DID80_01375 [Candidatus Marinamargulisbacteria bacterium SCGC AAA071-K20]|nr:hypothetical protein DID80_01375 [Candidatus Marinamargulisbacteria bacterium SCGC AAA071-K20]
MAGNPGRCLTVFSKLAFFDKVINMRKFTPLLIGILLLGLGVSFLHTHDGTEAFSEKNHCAVCSSQISTHTHLTSTLDVTPIFRAEAVVFNNSKPVHLSRFSKNDSRGPPV